MPINHPGTFPMRPNLIVPKPTPPHLGLILDRHRHSVRPHPQYPPFIVQDQKDQVGGNPAAVIRGVIAGVQAVDAVGKATHFATKAHDAVNKKFGDHGGPWYAKAARGITNLGVKLGWGPNGEEIYETQQQLQERKRYNKQRGSGPKQISWTLDGKRIFEKVKRAAEQASKARVKVSAQTGGRLRGRKAKK